MGYCGIFTNSNNKYEILHTNGTNNWYSNKSDFAEGCVWLGILELMSTKVRNNITGEICVMTDSRNVIKWTSQIYTPRKAANPGGEIWTAIQRTMKRFPNVTFTYEWVPGHPKREYNFSENKSAYLITRVHNEAFTIHRNMEQQNDTIKLKLLESGSILRYGKRQDRSINALIRQEDVFQCTTRYIHQKFPLYANLIDIKARDVFGAGLVNHELKCITGFNHHGRREALINPLLDDKCDVCRCPEDWNHILTCRINTTEHVKFIATLWEKS